MPETPNGLWFPPPDRKEQFPNIVRLSAADPNTAPPEEPPRILDRFGHPIKPDSPETEAEQ